MPWQFKDDVTHKKGASSRQQAKLTSRQDDKHQKFDTLVMLKRSQLVCDIVWREQFVGTKNTCRANKLI